MDWPPSRVQSKLFGNWELCLFIVAHSRLGGTIPGTNKELRKLWSVLKARKGDWPAILSLQSLENRPAHKDAHLSEYFVAKVGNDLVGCVAGRHEGEAGYLYGLVVNRKWRKQGIGHALTDECLAYLRMRRAKTVFALAMFWNLRFFKKHKFVVAKRSAFPDLIDLHGDFREDWGRHSTLLCVKF
jgi:N-acetylglutamate synthase-like GNAT family acetyltransferase